MPMWKRTIMNAGVSLTVVAGGALIAGGVASAHDASDHDGVADQFARGEVTVLGTGSFTIENHKGTTETIDTTSTTTFAEPGAPTAPTGVLVGEDVLVSLDPTATTPTATKVVVLLDRFSGKVTNVTSTSITLSVRRHSTKDVLVSSSTEYFSGKTTATGVTDGEFVTAFGLSDTTTPSELDALFVYIAPTPPVSPKPTNPPVVLPPKPTPGSWTKGGTGTGTGGGTGAGDHQQGAPTPPAPASTTFSPKTPPAGTSGSGNGASGHGGAPGFPGGGGPSGQGGPGQGGGFSGGGNPGNGGH
jgi:hypothetical protein